MLTAILTKFGLPLALVAGLGAGTFFGAKVLAPKPDKVDYDKVRKIIVEEIAKIPKTECPATVSLNTFDFDKIQNKKGNFHLNNHLSNVTIKIEAKDSTLIRELLKKVK